MTINCAQALLHSSHMYWEAKKSFEKHGVIADNVRVDVEKMLGQKNEVVKGLTSGIEGLFKKNKVLHRFRLVCLRSYSEKDKLCFCLSLIRISV